MGNDMGRSANRMAIGAMANATHFEKKELLLLQVSDENQTTLGNFFMGWGLGRDLKHTTAITNSGQRERKFREEDVGRVIIWLSGWRSTYRKLRWFMSLVPAMRCGRDGYIPLIFLEKAVQEPKDGWKKSGTLQAVAWIEPW